MKLALLTALVLTLSACHKDEGSSSGATGGSHGQGPSGSFFAGPIPPTVKLKPLKSAAFGEDGRALLFQMPEGWAGGVLPGYDYMANSKDASVVFRAAAATGMTGSLSCKDLAAPAKMAPLKATDLVEKVPAAPARPGAKPFDAREGTCTGTTARGPVEIHYLDLLLGKDPSETWHYAVMVSLPANATQEQRDQAMAAARSLELNGKNQYKP